MRVRRDLLAPAVLLLAAVASTAPAWAFLEPFIDFVQRDPGEGMPATDAFQVKATFRLG
jgi:hypothetical protein